MTSKQKKSGDEGSTGHRDTPDQEFKAARLDSLADAAGEGILGPNPVVGLSRHDIIGTIGQLLTVAKKEPGRTGKHVLSGFGRVWGAVRGHSTLAPGTRDRRFTDPAWTENVFYQRLLQSYLEAREETSIWLDEAGLPEEDQERAEFIVNLLGDAFAPSNTGLNPAAIKRCFETGGRSLADGVRNLIADIERNGGMPSQVDKSKFVVGRNLATSEGAVIFRNELLELIQYEPRGEKVFARPMLIVPPQINKYYVFDLSPEKSVVRHLLESGHQVFAVSWFNPTRDQAEWGIDDYVNALKDCLTAIEEITGSPDCNMTGACSGGITSIALLGHLAALEEPRINTLTLMVSVFDTLTDSQLGMFATDSTIESARKSSAENGVLDGQEMSRVFSWMRPNDLIWNYWVNNYLLGNDPPAFDVLYWNADNTRLPAHFHSQLLDLFKFNPLVEPNRVTICDTPIDLGAINQEIFVLAGVTDHITPWKACFRSVQHLGGEQTFVLSSSGHIQSILNPPGNPKARYFVNSRPSANLDEWMNGASERDGSWWEFWSDWLEERSASKGDAPTSLGSKQHVPGAAAPGNYVFG